MTLRVNEIFYSIHGEASYSGYPCIFIRLTGCNLRCSYCDTKYAYDEGEYFSIEDILQNISSYACSLILVTGGEPLIQEETPVLIEQLLAKGMTVILETNGSIPLGNVDTRCIRVLDIKCPSSGEEQENIFENLNSLTGNDEMKFVMACRDDYDYARTVLDRLPRNFPVHHIHFSPVSERLSPAKLATWILEDGLNVRLNIQLHKIIWPGEQRGV